MLSQHSRSSKLAFGPFEFDPGSGELFRHGSKVRLASQPGTVLDTLVDRPGELVTREDLRNRLWPGATSGDFEHGLNAAVNKLRQTLGDVANQPHYIETLPGVGYRFVAPVHPGGGAVLELVPNPAKSLQGPRLSQQRFPQWTAALAVVLLVFATGLLTALHRSSRPLAVRPTQLVILPPKGYYLEGGGVRQSFALSPDGERIAFTAKDSSGAFRLFLRDFSELESRPVADGDGAYSVIWTPDGRMLLFAARGKLRRIAVNGAASQVLSDAIPYFSSAIPFGPDRILVSNHRNSGVIASSGGIPEPINRLYSWAQTLPGGREFLYTIDDPQLHSLRARIAAVDGTDPGVEVVQTDSRVQYTASLRSDGGYLVYLRAGTLLAQPFDLAGRHVTADPRAITRHVPSFGPTGAADFSVSERGVLAYQTYVKRSQFIWVDRSGKRLSSASPDNINASFVRLSPDGRWLAAVPFDIERGVPEIWLFDAVSGAGRKAVFGPGIRHVPVWSPDSRRLVHLIDDHSWPRLGLSSIDGTPDQESLPNTGFMTPTDWSPDGRFILYDNSALPEITQGDSSDVFAIDMARNHKVIPILNTPFHEANAVFSPDGKWLAFLSNESGQAEIYMQALDRGNDSLRVIGERFLISRQGAQCLRWRRNGRELYYLGLDGTVYAVALVINAGRVRAAQPQPLFTIDTEALSTMHSVPSFDVAADGSRFVIPSMTPGESSALVVLQDWELLVTK
jgi:Tol biopolymer transport system component/DNA-binding winged helix-turn-helix (wHTH) protein